MWVFALLLAAAPPPLTPQDTLKLGEAYAQRGDAKKALPQLDKVLAAPELSDDERARAEAAYGLALLQTKKSADASAHLEKSVALKGTVEKTWLLLGMAYDGAGQADKSVDALKRGTQKLPKSAPLHHELGMALLQGGATKEAVPVLQKAADLVPGDPEVKTDLSYALVVDGQYQAGKDAANLALSLGKENADAWYNLGNAEAGLGNVAGAKSAFVRAIDVDELHVPSLLHLALLLQKTGDDQGALQRFQRVLQVEPEHPRARAGVGVSLAKLGTDDAKAKALLEKAVQIDPKWTPGLVSLADIALRAGEFDEAIKRLEAARKLTPDPAITAKLDAAKKAKKDAKGQKAAK